MILVLVLFHVKPSHQLWSRCARWAGFDPSTDQLALLDRYRDWLLTEAMMAGGLGPNEGPRVDSRHIADSLLFARGFEQTPSRVLDVGSGVGLPGIPLSIVMPDTEFVLLDRSRGRVELMRRVSRILDLPNVEVREGDIAGWAEQVDGMARVGGRADEVGRAGQQAARPHGACHVFRRAGLALPLSLAAASGGPGGGSLCRTRAALASRARCVRGCGRCR